MGKMDLNRTTSFRHTVKDAENIEKAREITYQDRAYYLYRRQVSKGDAIRYAVAKFVQMREAKVTIDRASYECPECEFSNITPDSRYCPGCGKRIEFVESQAN